MALGIASLDRTLGGEHQEPQVEVIVAAVLWVTDRVGVDVDGWEQDSQAVDARLLAGLPERHRGQVGVAVGVTAHLEPAAHLGVQHHQRPGAVGADDDGRTGEVRLGAAAVGSIGMFVDEDQNVAAVCNRIRPVHQRGVELGPGDVEVGGLVERTWGRGTQQRARVGGAGHGLSIMPCAGCGGGHRAD